MFAFGEFELDAACFELRRGTQRVDVQPKVIRLLVHLVLNRDRVVTTDELQNTLWPETSVGPGSLKRAVLGARYALGERGDSQSSIRTLRGHGYQFVRPVQPMAAAAPTAAQPAVQTRGFFGREPVLELLSASLSDALRGDSRCVLLTGAPGMGKSRTLEELNALAAGSGMDVWVGRCSNLEGVPAFWPFVQLLRAAVRERGASELQALMEHGASDIAAALPELRQTLPTLPPSAAVPNDASRFRFFDSFSVFLARAAKRRPLLIALDDLHHADPATLQLLTFVVRSITRAPLLIAGTFRRDPSASDALFDGLLREPSVHCIELVGLTRAALERCAVHMLGSPLPANALDALQEQTAGNPLFLRQLIERYRVTKGGDISELHLSSGLQAAIERHLEAVSLACRRKLQVAAVLGREFGGALLARVISEPVELLWRTLTEAVSSQLIEPSGDELGRFRFTHSLIQEALYRQLPQDERARLHGAAGLAIEAQGLGDNQLLLTEVTRHFVLAAPAYDDGRALAYCLRAGEIAQGRLAYEEAAAHYERALQLSVYAAPDPRRRMTLLFRKGEALSRTTEHAAARAALFEALNLARELGDAEMLFQAAALVASPPETGSVDAAQLAALQAALALLPEHDERRPLLQATIARSLAYGSEQAERVQLALHALQESHKLTNVRWRIETLFRCHEALPSNLEERVAIAGELLQLAHQQADSGALLRAWVAHIETCLSLGDTAGTESALASMESLAARVREPFFLWRSKILRGVQTMLHGELARSEQYAREALAYGAPLGEERARRIYCAQAVTLFMLQNRASEAEPLGREMALRYPTIPGWVARLGTIEWTLGRRDQARRCLDGIMDRGVAWICSEPLVVSGLCTVASLAAQLRDADASRQLYSALTPYADHHGLTLLGATSYGPITRHLAVLAAQFGQLELAEQHFCAALEAATRMRSPIYTALTAAGYAQLLLHGARAERRPRAIELISQSEELAQRHGLAALSAYCRALSKQHNLDGPRLQLIKPERTRRNGSEN